MDAISAGEPIRANQRFQFGGIERPEQFTAMLDELEGVMNAQACEYFREHPEYMPLTRAGILDAWSPADLELYDAILDTEGGAL